MQAPLGAPLDVQVTAGGDCIRVGASVAEATRDTTQVGAGSGLVYCTGWRRPSPTMTTTPTAHAPSWSRRPGTPVAVIAPRVRDPLSLTVRLWRFSVSAENPDSFDRDGDHGPYRGMAVHGAEVDLQRILDEVAAYWRPAGIRVRSKEPADRLPTGHLIVNKCSQKCRGKPQFS